MIKFNNRLERTAFISLFFMVILLVSPLSNAQQLNQVRAYMAPAAPQKSFFPSEQQVQEALAPHLFKAEQASSFPPLAQESQDFVNQFSTPDATKAVSQFVAPDLMINNRAMPQQYKQLSGHSYPQKKMKYPVMFGSDNNSFPPQKFDHTLMGGFPPSSIGLLHKDNAFSLPDRFPAVRLANNKGLNPMRDWTKWNGMGNSVPLLPKTTPLNRKKTWGDKHHSRPDFYTNFTDKGWSKRINTPRNLGRTPEGGSFPYAKIPDSIIATDAVTHQFPPVIEEAKYGGDASKWNVFDRD